MLSDEALAVYLLRGCRNKSRFRSKEKADCAIDRLAKRDILMFYYQCAFCHAYHLTSKEPDEFLNRLIRDSLIAKANKERAVC